MSSDVDEQASVRQAYDHLRTKIGHVASPHLSDSHDAASSKHLSPLSLSKVPSLPNHLSDHPSPTAALPSYDPAFLSPPLSRDSLDIPPFRPNETDHTSLSMRKRGKRTKRLSHRANTDNQGDETELVNNVHKSKSLPDLKGIKGRRSSSSLDAPGRSIEVEHKLRKLYEEQEKRFEQSRSRKSSIVYRGRDRAWTVPEKTSAAPLLSSHLSNGTLAKPSMPEVSIADTDHGSTYSISPPESTNSRSGLLNTAPRSGTRDTPAMILLRRATTYRPASPPSVPPPKKRISITFFPEPKFSDDRILTLPKLLSITRQSLDCTIRSATATAASIHSEHSSKTGQGRTSIDRSGAQPSRPSIAEPVVTEVDHPPWSRLTNDEDSKFRNGRRLSTKFVTDTTVHEIIWDENVISSGSEVATLSSGASDKALKSIPSTKSSSRRLSTAAELLSYQLRSDTSRRASLAEIVFRSEQDQVRVVETFTNTSLNSGKTRTFSDTPDRRKPSAGGSHGHLAGVRKSSVTQQHGGTGVVGTEPRRKSDLDGVARSSTWNWMTNGRATPTWKSSRSSVSWWNDLLSEEVNPWQEVEH